MNILLTTHQMADFAGSEVYTYELAKGLIRAGHKVVVYSRYIDSFEVLFTQAKIEFVTDLRAVKDRHFDVAHVHHHINALEVRYFFPRLPIFFLSHGAKTFLEFPPKIDINITQWGAVSESVKKMMISQGVKKSKIVVVNNMVDQETFTSHTTVNETPKKALIISNKMTKPLIERIEKACRKLGIEVAGIGKSFTKRVSNADLPQFLNSADIVFTIGRGVVETMMCGRIPFVFDAPYGGDGLLTTKNLHRSAKQNFNGSAVGKYFTVRELIKELKKYDATQGPKLRAIAEAEYSTAACVQKLESIYTQTIINYRHKAIDQDLLFYIVETVRVTRLHTFSRSEQTGTLAKIRNLRQDLKYIVRNRTSKFLSKPILPNFTFKFAGN